MGGLTHIAEDGSARMVDVGGKDRTVRIAVATGRVAMLPGTLQSILDGSMKKGDVLGVARIAGIMAAKRTHELVPLCHPIALTSVEVDLQAEGEDAIVVHAAARCTGETGVEMEALSAVSVACLTVYDMAKAIDRGMRIEGIRLLEKSGGKSGHWRAEAETG